MRAHRIRTLFLTAALALLLAVPATAAARRLIIGGSTSVLPLAQKLAAAYHHQFPRIPSPSVTGGQSDIGIQGVNEGRFDIGDSSRDPILGVDPHGLVFTKIARDGVCIVTNKGNPLNNLTQEKVEAIFTGSIRDWGEVPGSHISGPIDLFDRDSASGTQDAFRHIFFTNENTQVSPSATAETSNGLEQQSVQADKQAIGFVSFAYTPGTNAVGYNGVPCTLRNAKSNQYGGVRNFWMVTKGVPRGQAGKFIAWVTKNGNRVVRNIVNSSWIAIH